MARTEKVSAGAETLAAQLARELLQLATLCRNIDVVQHDRATEQRMLVALREDVNSLIVQAETAMGGFGVLAGHLQAMLNEVRDHERRLRQEFAQVPGRLRRLVAVVEEAVGRWDKAKKRS